jgi:hypothetical protein
MGRWESYIMNRYLHIAANPEVQRFAKRMLASGKVSFNPGINQQAHPTGHFSASQKFLRPGHNFPFHINLLQRSDLSATYFLASLDPWGELTGPKDLQ